MLPLLTFSCNFVLHHFLLENLILSNSLIIGMDAQVEYDFHHQKKINPSLAQGPIPNKVLLLYLKKFMRSSLALMNAFLVYTHNLYFYQNYLVAGGYIFYLFAMCLNSRSLRELFSNLFLKDLLDVHRIILLCSIIVELRWIQLHPRMVLYTMH